MYKIDRELAELGEQIVAQDRPELEDCSICYMRSDKEKKTGNMIVYADTEKLSEKMSALTGIDFVITFYKDAEGLTETARHILMEHELMHIGWDDGKKKIVPHDVQDFGEIIRKYGLQWHKAQQTSMFDEEE